MNETESDAQFGIRITVGILLAVETVILFFFSAFMLIFVPFLGGLAYIWGAGDASDDQIVQGWTIILLTAVSPFLVTGLTAVASFGILRRRHRRAVVTVCVLLVIAAVAFYGVAKAVAWGTATEEESAVQPYILYIMLPFIVPLAGIPVAMRMKTGSAVCPSCNGIVPRDAEKCVHCGVQLARSANGCLIALASFLCVLGLISWPLLLAGAGIFIWVYRSKRLNP